MRAFVLLAMVALACADTLTVGNVRISAFDGTSVDALRMKSVIGRYFNS